MWCALVGRLTTAAFMCYDDIKACATLHHFRTACQLKEILCHDALMQVQKVTCRCCIGVSHRPFGSVSTLWGWHDIYMNTALVSYSPGLHSCIKTTKYLIISFCTVLKGLKGYGRTLEANYSIVEQTTNVRGSNSALGHLRPL